ncbi:MAG: HAMP domain-containing protein [Gammaproteobacteria bacterium]|jgi:HAMP domain-containing protein
MPLKVKRDADQRRAYPGGEDHQCDGRATDDVLLGSQAQVTGVSGTWRDLPNTVNVMARNLTDPVRDVSEVTKAVSNGDLTKRVTADARGEILQLKDTVNVMVDRLARFSAELTRVAAQFGTEGKLGGQADIEGVNGTWKWLTDNVNAMASNLTSQVRDIAVVTSAVAAGDLTKCEWLSKTGDKWRTSNAR